MGNQNLQRAGGAFGILTASIAFSIASFLKKDENSYFNLPVYSLASKSPLDLSEKSKMDIHVLKLQATKRNNKNEEVFIDRTFLNASSLLLKTYRNKFKHLFNV